jgi:ankyrin repeat protein
MKSLHLLTLFFCALSQFAWIACLAPYSHRHRLVSSGPGNHQRSRRNHAADEALSQACYLEVQNAKPEEYDDVARALKEGANPNVSDRYGFTALMHEALWGHRRTVLLLLHYGASARRTDTNGSNALIYASASPVPDEKIVEALIRHGASITHRNKNGHSALYLARKSGHRVLTSLLLKHMRKHRR